MGTVEVRDPIHGLVDLEQQAWKVVDTAAFQRLRGIQQLALTNLVYPGARHSRFEHCVGAYHIARRLVDRLQHRNAEINVGADVALAALVHDIGHGPFSHVSEEVFGHFGEKGSSHEQISAAIVRHDPEVRRALTAPKANWIADLLTTKARSVEKDIVAGPADIDKLDYLLRDSHYCGVAYGQYDLDKVIESARGLREVAGTYLGFHEDGVYALEELLLARYHMHRQVYGHKTRVATDLMLVRAMISGVTEKILPRGVFGPPLKPDAAFVKDYLVWDDSAVTKALLKSKRMAGDIMRALADRKLLKQVLVVPERRFDEITTEESARAALLAPEATVFERVRRSVEASVAKAAGVDEHWVALVHSKTANPLSNTYDVQVAEKTILIVDDKGRTSNFWDRSEVFRRAIVAPRIQYSLYLRPPQDRDLPKRVAARVEEEALTGLKLLATEGAKFDH
jgi:HD superfamily phosphohydrolase